MYKKLLNKVRDIMNRWGLVKVIIISDDYYQLLTESQRRDIEGYLTIGNPIKWMIVTDKKEYYDFKYSAKPCKDKECHTKNSIKS